MRHSCADKRINIYFCTRVMMRRKGQKRRMYIATLLLAVLMPAYIVTIFHHHNYEHSHLQECVTCDVHHHHIHKNHLGTSDTDSSQNCYICHFAFSPVDKARSFEVSFCHDFVHNSYSDVVTSFRQSITRYYSLRAPPSPSLMA